MFEAVDLLDDHEDDNGNDAAVNQLVQEDAVVEGGRTRLRC